MLKKEWGVKSNGKLPHLFIPSKTATLVREFATEDLPLGRTATLVPEFVVEDLPSAELHLGSCTCSKGPTHGQNTLLLLILIFN